MSEAGPGDLLPAFSLGDIHGETWSAADLRGSPSVLFCFASW